MHYDFIRRPLAIFANRGDPRREWPSLSLALVVEIRDSFCENFITFFKSPGPRRVKHGAFPRGGGGGTPDNLR